MARTAYVEKLQNVYSLLSILNLPDVALTPAEPPGKFRLTQTGIVPNCNKRPNENQPFTSSDIA